MEENEKEIQEKIRNLIELELKAESIERRLEYLIKTYDTATR